MANGGTWIQVKYEYSAGNSNSTLRGHLDRLHRDEYLQIAAEKGWTVQLASQKDVRRVVLGNTVEPVPTRTPFSVDAAIDHLVRFIVATDQASAD